MTTRRGRDPQTEQTVSATEYVNMVKENAALRTTNRELTNKIVSVEGKFASKPVWKSKTIVFNASALIAYIASVYLSTEVSPELMLTIVTVGNAVLRYITKGEITLT